jgi:hypothetical protein
MFKWFTDKVLAWAKTVQDKRDVADQLKLAMEALESCHGQNLALQEAFVVLKAKYESAREDALVTIACLLTAAGGPVTLSRDLIEVVRESSFNVKVDNDTSGNVIVKLLDESGEPHEPEEQTAPEATKENEH